MNLERMLEMCRRDQWRVSDLDWSGRPRPLSCSDEMAVVQYFTDMAGIERLAAALFETQRQKARDPTLAAIFATFVSDEERHAQVAERLAVYFDVHRYRRYAMNRDLQNFAPHFVEMVHLARPELANAFITGGELMLDVALLRSLNDYVADDMMRAAMELINRDESRHVAVDFHMVEHYSSEAYLREVRAQPLLTWENARAVKAVLRTLYYARPFFRSLFFEPMQRLDPSGQRLKEAMKRFQMLGAKSQIARLPFSRYLRALQLINDTPVLGRAFNKLFSRLFIVEPQLFGQLTNAAEEARAARLSFDQLAEEALELKRVN